MLWVMAFFVGIIIVRLFYVQVLDHSRYVALAQQQHWMEKEIPANRGQIYVREGSEKYPMAINITKNLIYASPIQMKDIPDASKKLSSVLNIPEKDLNDLMGGKKAYVVLKHYLSDDETAKIKQLNLEGIYLTPEATRYYPEEEIASHVLGFVNAEGEGQYGIEGFFNNELKGKKGTLSTEKDATGVEISMGTKDLAESANGDDIVLTIDRTLQYKVEKILKEGVEKHRADSGSVIVMDPKTGKVIAMANYPNFNPNAYKDITDYNVFKNNAIASIWEPGSIFKVITMGAALNEEKVTPETIYTDTGAVNVGGHTIKNSDGSANGKQTMTQVLEKSLNTGAIFAKDQIGNGKFFEYLKNFGFGLTSGIELATEDKGDIRPVSDWQEINFDTATFGQGIAITPIQMITAISAIANGGKLMEPHIIDEIIHANGQSEKIDSKMVRQVLSAKAAANLGAMMVSVVEKGHGYQAKVPGFYIAGKTGTAQVPIPGGGGYYKNKTIGSFAGFGPVDNPRFAILVKIDVPKDVIWAESSAAPIFGQVAQELVNYYQIPPTRTDNLK